MEEVGTDQPTTEGTPRKRRRPWILRATLVFVLINALAVVALATRGSAHPDSCGGGFSGYSGGGGQCSSDMKLIYPDSPDPVALHGRLFYLAEGTNLGPDEAYDVQVSVHLPPGMQIDWVLTPGDPYGYCSTEGQNVFCTFYDVRAHQKVAVSMVIRPSYAGTIRTFATISSNNADPNQKNNTAHQSTRVTG